METWPALFTLKPTLTLRNWVPLRSSLTGVAGEYLTPGQLGAGLEIEPDLRTPEFAVTEEQLEAAPYTFTHRPLRTIV